MPDVTASTIQSIVRSSVAAFLCLREMNFNRAGANRSKHRQTIGFVRRREKRMIIRTVREPICVRNREAHESVCVSI